MEAIDSNGCNMYVCIDAQKNPINKRTPIIATSTIILKIKCYHGELSNCISFLFNTICSIVKNVCMNGV